MGAGVAGLLLFLSTYTGWKETQQGARREWRKGNVIHLDDNGDGLVDEEDILDPKTGGCTVRRDANHDGYFDLQYTLTPSGVATHIRTIHEKAPRH